MLVLYACNKPHPCKEVVLHELNVADFHTIRLSDEIRVGVTFCEGSNYSFKAKGCPKHMNDMELIVKDSVVTAKYKHTQAFGAVTEFEVTSPIEIKVLYFKTPKILRIDHSKKEQTENRKPKN